MGRLEERFVERLRNLRADAEFSGPEEVADALECQDESYEEQARSRRGTLNTAGRDRETKAKAPVLRGSRLGLPSRVSVSSERLQAGSALLEAA